MNFQKIIGLSLTFGGLIYLLYPKDTFELSFYHAFLMMVSGLSWGIYTILGKGSKNALHHTTDNFVKSTLFLIIFYLLFISKTHISQEGILLAVTSGGITSALGYTLWYQILPKIQMMTSGIIQLIVPPIAIFLSVLLLGEVLTSTLLVSTVMILGGIFIALIRKKGKI